MKITLDVKEASEIVADKFGVALFDVEIIGMPLTGKSRDPLEFFSEFEWAEFFPAMYRRDDKIKAVKFLRALTHMGIAEAKNFVERFEPFKQ